MSPYCPISSTVPHTFTTPTHLTLPPHTFTPSTTTAGQLPDSFWPTIVAIAANTFLSRMHFLCLKALTPSMNNTRATNTRATNTRATNTRANRSLSHERKTHSPPLPSSLLAQQAAQAIQSSSPALSPPPPRTPTANRTWSRSCYTFGGAFVARASNARDTSTTALRALACRLPLGMFSHFAPCNRRPCMALSCSGWRPFRYFDHRALIHWMYRSYANALSISIRNRFTYICGARWSSCA